MRHLRPFLLLAALLLAAPAVQAQLYQAPGPTSPTSKDQVELYAPHQDKEVGIVSIPDSKLAVLVQPEGREWRGFRTVILRWGAAIAILGMAGLLLLFYLVRGTIRIGEGRAGRTVPRFAALDRFAHWTTATSFLLLALTGLVVTFGRPLLIPLIGHPAFTTLAQSGKAIHNFLSVPFVFGILLMIVLWVRDNIPEKADLVWLKTMGGLFSKSGEHPECGRFNAGQKGIFWAVVLGGGALAATGFLLLAPFALTGIGGMQIIHVVHGALAALMIAIILAHIYIGSVGMEGAFDAMGTGHVDENWARDHHRRWYDEQVGKGRVDPPPAVRPHPAE
ncbi:formate dehydrogenase subunit gamma [Azospirillum sp. TSO22-1]|uniref:formate dehydrogenase subunit gamma n=1 Tax=Azospirillum sp. TSO22-1 TaxID=716789 RepID=UPI000D619CE9|nr:formate dehydrogenase subunit gamma [Azospirillum sp. TSO22-1]PWC36951.1 formate dehydrogenase [Azospirillum sp. TSO22-1]